MTKLSPSCNRCRVGKRRCDVKKSSKFDSANGVSDPAEEIIRFYGKQHSKNEHEAIAILSELYGAADYTFSPASVCHKYKNKSSRSLNNLEMGYAGRQSYNLKSKEEFISVCPLKCHSNGRGSSGILVLERGVCDDIVSSIGFEDPTAAFYVDDVFKSVYEKAFIGLRDKQPYLTSSERVMIYSTLALGSLSSHIVKIEDQPIRAKSLFIAASSYIGLAMLENTYETAHGLSIFAYLCKQTGNLNDQGKFNRIALLLMTEKGLHKESTYKRSEGLESRSYCKLFWHIYSVTRAYSETFGEWVEYLPISQVTAPIPERGPNDDEAGHTYLMAKIKLLKLTAKECSLEELEADVKAIKEEVIEALKLQGILEWDVNTVQKFIMETDKAQKQYARNYSIYIKLRSMTLQSFVRMNKVGKVDITTTDDLNKILCKEADSLLKEAAKYFSACGHFPAVSLCYIYHQIFLAAILLVFYQQFGYHNDESINIALDIFTEKERSSIKGPKYLDFLIIIRERYKRSQQTEQRWTCNEPCDVGVVSSEESNAFPNNTEMNIDDFSNYSDYDAFFDSTAIYSEPGDRSLFEFFDKINCNLELNLQAFNQKTSTTAFDSGEPNRFALL
ncbi:hypothetical protein V1511DRAFT_105880 [Dipodascopsis uninucleata]